MKKSDTPNQKVYITLADFSKAHDVFNDMVKASKEIDERHKTFSMAHPETTTTNINYSKMHAQGMVQLIRALNLPINVNIKF